MDSVRPTRRGSGIRDRFLRALVLFGVALVAITESLGAFGLIRRGPLIVCWGAVLAIALASARRKRFHFRLAPKLPKADPVVLICSVAIGAILTLTGVTAAFSPPNSADAMAYHMPRVVYWAEQSSVQFFPTPYLPQIMLQPLAEYMMLHLYVLSGGDQLINFVQWFASLASMIGVSSIARIFGAEKASQAIAALFCATLPAGILASSGAKNDYWLAMWLVAAIYFALSFTRTNRLGDALAFGAALGLALLTKATAYLLVPWPLAAIFLARAGKSRRRLVTGALIAVACGLAINAPHYVRNYDLSGSIMGFDSAQADGFFRWRNETFGWKQTASNILRNLSEQLGSRSPGWNERVYELVIAAHKRLGIDVNDPGTTWRWSAFAPPRNANHEANAPNRWHLAILFAISCALILRALRRRERERPLYSLALLCAFFAFCVSLKWQPFLARLLLPVFVLGAPLAAAIGEIGERKWSPIVRRFVQLAICLFLLDIARLPLLENWVRPLRGSKSVLRAPRSAQYFADMSQWNNEASYRKTVDVLANSSCDTVGIDITNLTLEYPLQVLLRERKPQTRYLHTGVQNASSRYRQPIDAAPCAVVCLDCASDSKRLRLYDDFHISERIDNFVIFLRETAKP
jgi:4-amino-4-deoxy-L-arabinose transferase-like glycosyltransferase